MRRLIPFHLPPLPLPALLLALSACATPASTDTGASSGQDTQSGGDTSPPDDADDPEHAVSLGFDEEVSDTLHDNDVDWYKISGHAGQQFRIQVTNEDEKLSDTSLDTVVEVFDSTLTRIAWEDEHPIGDVTTFDTVCFGFFPAEGDYFVKVEDKATFGGGTATVDSTEYTLQALSPSSVPTEPDTLLSVGKDVALDTDDSWYALPVASEAEGDVDYLKLDFAHDDGTIFVATAEHIESSPYAPLVEMYNGDAELVMHAESTAIADGRAIVSPPGTSYILAIQDGSGGSGLADGAWVFVRNAPAGYGNTRETEPNEVPAEGVALTLADQSPDAGFWYADFVEGRVSTALDEDWYTFTTPEDAFITVAFGALAYGSLLQADVALYDDDGGVIAIGAASEGADPDVATAAKVSAGSYSLRVRSLDGTPAGEGAYYRLAVHVTSVAL